MGNTLEEHYIRKIEAATRGIRMNTKKPEDVGSDVSTSLTKLKSLNEGMHDDLMDKYKKVVADYNNRK